VLLAFAVAAWSPPYSCLWGALLRSAALHVTSSWRCLARQAATAWQQPLIEASAFCMMMLRVLLLPVTAKLKVLLLPVAAKLRVLLLPVAAKLRVLLLARVLLQADPSPHGGAI
jgi:hypothetical protein